MAGRETTLCTMPTISAVGEERTGQPTRGAAAVIASYTSTRRAATIINQYASTVPPKDAGKYSWSILEMWGPRSAYTSTTIDQAKSFARCYFVFHEAATKSRLTALSSLLKKP